MLTQIINGKIFTPQGWLDEGSVLIRDNKILEVTNCDLALIGAKQVDAKGMYIVPGYVYACPWWRGTRFQRMYGGGVPRSYKSASETRGDQYFPYFVFVSFFRNPQGGNGM